MPRVAVDLTITNLIPDGIYVGTVQKLAYQVSTTQKDDSSGKYSWKKDTVQDVDFETFNQVSDDRRRLHYQINIPGKSSVFHDLYMGESSRGFLKAFMKACGVIFDKGGFDPEEAVGKQVNIEVTTTEDSNGASNEFKFSKV